MNGREITFNEENYEDEYNEAIQNSSLATEIFTTGISLILGGPAAPFVYAAGILCTTSYEPHTRSYQNEKFSKKFFKKLKNILFRFFAGKPEESNENRSGSLDHAYLSKKHAKIIMFNQKFRTKLVRSVSWGLQRSLVISTVLGVTWTLNQLLSKEIRTKLAMYHYKFLVSLVEKIMHHHRLNILNNPFLKILKKKE
jgi:hypothetical protein